jgi:lipopolysaccharide transport system permease protein
MMPLASQQQGGRMPETIVIEPGQSGRAYWRELWRYRELFQVLAWRDLSVRYKQTVIGVAWALIRPLLTMIVFTLIFGRIAHLPSEAGAPYPLMVFAGLLPWMLFSTGLSEAAGSLINNANLVTKVYFPRMIVPTATIIVAFVDFLVSFVILVALMAWYAFLPSWQIVFLPLFAVLALLATLGPALWLTALNVRFRDFRYVIPFLVQLSLYISPVGFSSANVPEQWRLIYALNPLVGIIDGFRWCILGGRALDAASVALSVAVTAFFLWFGINRFRSMERSFADLI